MKIASDNVNINSFDEWLDLADINGDGTMEWTELMQFLLDTVN